MKKILLMAVAALMATMGIQARDSEPNARMSCTSIMVGKRASTDGSVMTSHTCDSWYRT
ncbi:MAG: C69 family dipeptidase, partial [Muribaculaceae bacterium]|nr:C69 family dipeptidase [Muribaculaceae bacterium]